eukprot:12931761-Prorocentrum_lima.AAC.1
MELGDLRPVVLAHAGNVLAHPKVMNALFIAGSGQLISEAEQRDERLTALVLKTVLGSDSTDGLA